MNERKQHMALYYIFLINLLGRVTLDVYAREFNTEVCFCCYLLLMDLPK